VLPRWLLATFGEDEGPFVTWRGKEPVLTRDGAVRPNSSLPGVKLPMCRRHNGALAGRFESSIHSFRDRLFLDGGGGQFDSDQAATFGLWLVKTWLLLAHPRAEHVDDIERPHGWAGAPEEIWSWMVTGDEPPGGLSVWASRRDDIVEPCATSRVMQLPTVIDGPVRTQFRVKETGIRGLDVVLVYHPAWRIDHPLELEGRAIRMWPRAVGSGAVDFGSLPPVARRDTVWHEGPTLTFEPGRSKNPDLPPLAADIEFFAFEQMASFGIVAVGGG
jgi:hypothetical protein